MKLKIELEIEVTDNNIMLTRDEGDQSPITDAAYEQYVKDELGMCNFNSIEITKYDVLK